MVTSHQYVDRETLSGVSPPLFEESSRVKFYLFLDFMAFYFTKNIFIYFNVDREASASGDFVPQSPRSPNRALSLDPAGGLLTPDSLLSCCVPKLWRQIDAYGGQ